MLLTIYAEILQIYRKRSLHESQRKTLSLSFVNPRKGRSSRLQIFFKIGVPKNFANFTGKRLCSSLFLIKFKKIDSNTGVFQ